jgi:hypothetical protein
MNKYQCIMNKFQYYFVIEKYHLPKQEEIILLEEQLKFNLPSDYKVFLLDYGLSAFEGYICFTFQENYTQDNKGLLDVFFGIYPNDVYDLIYNYNTYQGRIPSHLLPIANDPGGNIICISTSSDSLGSIYFWDHEEEVVVEQNEEIDTSNLYLVANSFDEFMNSLEKLEDEDDL